MLEISTTLSIPEEEIRLSAIRAQGAGGQNVNKVSSAIHLRFDINASSLPQRCKERLLDLPDKRINDCGVLVIKAQRFRTREKNTADALQRLRTLIQNALVEPRKRIATKPTRASGERRLAAKTHRARIKQLRGKVE